MAFQNTIKLRVTSTPKHRVAKVKCRIVKYDFAGAAGVLFL